MGISSFFRKITRKNPKNFADVDVMCTRPMVLSSTGKKTLTVEFIAERDKTGHWKIFDITHGDETKHPPAIRYKKADILQRILRKHLGDNSQASKMNFDEAFLILRDLEETYAEMTSASPGKEPHGHYMVAYRLLSKEFRQSLDELFQRRREPPPKTGPKPGF